MIYMDTAEKNYHIRQIVKLHRLGYDISDFYSKDTIIELFSAVYDIQTSYIEEKKSAENYIEELEDELKDLKDRIRRLTVRP